MIRLFYFYTSLLKLMDNRESFSDYNTNEASFAEKIGRLVTCACPLWMIAPAFQREHETADLRSQMSDGRSPHATPSSPFPRKGQASEARRGWLRLCWIGEKGYDETISDI